MIIKQLKKFKHTKLWATTLNVILGLIVINLIVQFFPISLDLSANKIHSLSSATRNVLNQTDDLVTIKAYISNNLPPQLLPLQQTVISTLNEYDQHGGTKVKVIIKDPQKSSEAESEVQSLGIPPMQFSSVKSDQYQIVKGYFGLGVFYAGKQEIIPALQNINNLEYRLTAAINNLTKDKLPQIGITSGSGEIELAQLPALRQALSVNYNLQPIDLTSEEVDLSNFQTLLVIGPKDEVSEDIQKKFDSYLMSGKGLIFLIDKINVSQNLFGEKISLNIDDWLKHYGLEVEDKLVVDASSAIANFQTQQGRFITPYPFWVKTRTENANKEIPVTASLEEVIFPWASPVKLSKGAEFLWKTTKSAKSTDQINNLGPQQTWNFQNNTSQLVLAGVQKNDLASYFDESKSSPVKLAVVGDADFISNQNAATSPENINFILNLVDYLSQDNNLIDIRSKQIASRPLRTIGENQKQTYKYASLAAGPILLILLAGFVRWQRRKFNLNWKFENV